VFFLNFTDSLAAENENAGIIYGMDDNLIWDENSFGLDQTSNDTDEHSIWMQVIFMSYDETEYNDFVSLSEKLWATDSVNLYAPILSVTGQKDGMS
jgi:hypothetical protein